jgi:hypothetical protein
MTLRSRRLLLLLGLGFGIVGIVVAPELALSVLSIAIPITVVAAAIAIVYTLYVYRRQSVPRSRFFGLYVEAVLALLLVGVWVGYLTVARLLERIESEYRLPAPSALYSAPISALIVLIVFSGPIRFAWELYRRRRFSASVDVVAEIETEAANGVGSAE